MANLETLELKISANAQEATKGLGKLISSLIMLNQSLTAPTAAMKELNAQLGLLKKYSSNTFKNVVSSMNGAKNIKETTSAIEKQTDAVKKLKGEVDVSDSVAEKLGEATEPYTIQSKHPGINGLEIYTPSQEEYARESVRTAEYLAKLSERIATNEKNRQKYAMLNGSKGIKAETEAIKEQASAVKSVASSVGSYNKVKEESVSVGKECASVSAEEAEEFAKAQNKLDILQMKQSGTLNDLGKALGAEEQNDYKVGTLTERYQKLTSAIEDATNATETANKNDEIRSARLEKLNNETERAAAQTEKLKAQTELLNAKTEQVRARTEALGNEDVSVKKLSSAFSNLLTQVGRIGKTMLIRQAIRAIINGAKEGLTNYYNYAKSISSSYASSLDSMKSGWNQLKNQIGATLGSALATVLPILETISSAALVAFNAISALLALLNGKATYTQAKKQVGEYAEEVGGAAAATKELLAAFDELNVIQSSSSGSGSDGSIDYSKLYQEVELPTWMTEWKGVIEAVVYGTLGAVILPKIWEWVKKIFGLFTGSDGTVAKTVIDKLLGGDSKLPSITEAITEMGLYAAAAEAANLALDTLKDKIVAIKAALEGFSLIETVLQGIIALLTSMVGGTVKVEVDRKKYDEFKNEVKDNPIKITAQVSGDSLTDIKTWLNETSTKKIYIKFIDTTQYNAIVVWTATTDEKKISLKFIDTTQYNAIAVWAVKDETKKISLKFVDDGEVYGHLVNWIAKEDSKYIALKFLDNNAILAQLDLWVQKTEDKKYNLVFNNGTDIISSLADWIANSDFWNKPIWEYVKDKDFWSKPIWEYFFGSNGTPELEIPISVDYDENEVNKTKKDLEDTVEETNPVITTSVTYEKEGTNKVLTGIKKVVEATDTKINVGLTKDSKFNETRDKIANDVANKKPQMAAALAKNASFDTNKDKFAKEVSDKKSNMQVSVAKIAGAKGFDKTLKTYVDTVNAKSGYVKVGATKKTGSDGFDTALGKITAMVNKKTGTVKAFVTLADGQKVALETQLAKLGVDMKVSATISNMASLVLTLKTKIKETFGTLFTKMGWKWEAEGGIVNSGDIFVANENGKSEMIGRFGNHTGVANQEQMVEAMARGVQYAQESQNSLLREQNALLRAILAKEGNVSIGASSALGRTVKQSLAMYNSMTGG